MKTTTIQIEIPSPPNTHFLLPQEWKGEVKLQEEDMGYMSEFGWYRLTPDDIWQTSLAVARLRPRNPQNLSDDVFRKLPMDARALSDAEFKRLEELGGLVVEDEKLLSWDYGDWLVGMFGSSVIDTYATLHPANYYLELPDSAFVGGKKQEAKTQPKFKVGDKVKVLTGVQKGTDIATITNVNYDQSLEITFDDGATGSYDAVNLAHVKLVCWMPDTRPAGPVFIRQKDKPYDVMLALQWTPVYVLLAGGHRPQWKRLLEAYEWSADGKNNWQPCGNYEPDNS